MLGNLSPVCLGFFLGPPSYLSIIKPGRPSVRPSVTLLERASLSADVSTMNHIHIASDMQEVVSEEEGMRASPSRQRQACECER